jgi:feruloyl esterase
MKMLTAATLAMLMALALHAHTSAVGTSCDALAHLALPDTTINSATAVAAGPFTPPGAAAGAQPLNLPAFCRVVATTKPAVRYEVWLPQQDWNGKFQGVGNGGSAGVISYAAMATALNRGYATASTDTGHVNKGAYDYTWALGHPELVADFGHRGLHVMTINGKDITRAFYAKPPDHSYYVGCSKGGQQGLMEAQRYPEDYDGLIAGDPANNWTRFYAGGHLWYALATLKDPESYIPSSKLPLLDKSVVAACDANDGLKDGLLNDPRTCHFDPTVLTCKAGQDAESCLTPKQVQAVKDIWSGARNAAGQVFPGLLPGGEAAPGAGWSGYVTGTAPFTSNHYQAGNGFFTYAVFENPKWDFRTLDFDKDLAFARQKVGPMVDAVDPNLGPLQRRGAKLIVYHGWSDPDISPLNSINYFENVVSTLGGTKSHDEALRETEDFFRLFMVPGMGHCRGGSGPNTFDMVSALEQWVEHGVAPKQVLASHLTSGVVDRTRPLCPYPQSAQYTGMGSTDDAANFVCKLP